MQTHAFKMAGFAKPTNEEWMICNTTRLSIS